MGRIKELTSEQLRDIYCAPENTDDPESIDFEDGEPEQAYCGNMTFTEVVTSFEGRNDKNVFED
jgi:hypothetical protein